MHESSFKHLLPYLSLLINGLLEMWLGLLTFYVWILRGKQKIFLRESSFNMTRGGGMKILKLEA